MREYLNLGLKLMVICLVAALALAGVNALTAPVIAEQQKEIANAARKELIPDADDFIEAVDMSFAAEKYPTVTNAYTAVKGDETIGYVMEVNGKGFGGTLYMNVGVLTDGTIAGMRITSHSETEGLGSRATEPAFYEQFTNIPDTSSVQTMSGATITSKGVLAAVETAVEFAKECGPLLSDPNAELAPVDPYANVLGGFVDADGLYNVYVKGEGFGGDIVVRFAIDQSGTFQAMEMVQHSETPGLGATANDPAFADQFKGLTAPVELGKNLDAISGATVTSTAIMNAANLASDYAAEKGAELPEGSVDTFVLPEGEKEEAAAPAADAPEGAITVAKRGMMGDVTVSVVFNADGTIASVTADTSGETPGIGSQASEAAFLDQFVGQTCPVDVNTISGATVSSTAVIDAVNEAGEQAK